jgi:hypothetical protein
MTYPSKSATPVVGKLTRIDVEFTNVSGSGTAYTAGDIVSGSPTIVAPYEFAGAFREKGGSAYIVGVGAMTNVSSKTPRFRLHFYNGVATVQGDNVQRKALYTNDSFKLGWLDLPAMTSSADISGSMSRSFDYTVRHPVVAAPTSSSLYVAVETLDAFTPAATSEKYTITVILDNN